MIKVGDKVVVTDVPEGCGLEGIEVGSVGEVVKRVDKTCVDILFEGGTQFLGFDGERKYLESKNYGHTHVFLVEKFDGKEEKDGMLEVGDKVVVTEVLIENVLVCIEVGKVGEIIAVDYSDYTKMPYLINFGDFTLWSGREFLVEKLEDVETSETQSEGEIKGAEIQHSVNVKGGDVVEALTVEEVIKPVIEDKQDTKEIDNPPLEGAYNTVIKKDGLTVYTNSTVIEKDGLTIYTNYSVEVVGEVMRVGGVDDLVSNFDESEDAGGELGE